MSQEIKNPFSKSIKSEIYCIIRVTSVERRLMANKYKLLMKMSQPLLQEELRKMGYKSDLSITSRMIMVGMCLQDEFGYKACEDFNDMLQFFK